MPDLAGIDPRFAPLGMTMAPVQSVSKGKTTDFMAALEDALGKRQILPIGRLGNRDGKDGGKPKAQGKVYGYEGFFVPRDLVPTDVPVLLERQRWTDVRGDLRHATAAVNTCRRGMWIIGTINGAECEWMLAPTDTPMPYTKGFINPDGTPCLSAEVREAVAVYAAIKLIPEAKLALEEMRVMLPDLERLAKEFRAVYPAAHSIILRRDE